MKAQKSLTARLKLASAATAASLKLGIFSNSSEAVVISGSFSDLVGDYQGRWVTGDPNDGYISLSTQTGSWSDSDKNPQSSVRPIMRTGDGATVSRGPSYTTRYSEGELIEADHFMYFGTNVFRELAYSATDGTNRGPFYDRYVAQSGYVGFQLAGGEQGWVHVTIQPGYNAQGLEMTLGDWAYESVAYKSIEASSYISVPEPTTTALLMASGAAAMAMLRRRRDIKTKIEETA